MTARFASLQLTEPEAERGSAILDALVAIEHERLSDATLSRKAQVEHQSARAGMEGFSELSQI